MCLDTKGLIPNHLNPTFLFAWKGVRLKNEANYHGHDFTEVAFLLSGSGQYRVDGTIYPVREGDLLILNPGMQHQAIVTDLTHPMVEFFVGFHDFCIPGLPAGFLQEPGQHPVISTEGDLKQRLYRLVASMDVENASAFPGRYIMMKSYLLQMITLILRSRVDEAASQAKYIFDSTSKKYLVEQMIQYFEEHYNEKISLDRIAENMYLSPFYLSKVFKSETGSTPIRHLIDIRLEKARELLGESGEMSIREVALAVGYEDAYHFSKLFKKKYGVAPSSVRKGVPECSVPR